MLIRVVIVLACALLPGSVPADEAGRERVRSALKDVIPDMEISNVRESKIDGLYEVTFGADVVYVTGDGRYLLRGDLLDLDQHRNVSEDRRESMRQEILGGVPAGDLIEFAPKNPRHVIYVFTDTDCGFCRRLHQQVPAMNEHGIAVRYLAFPRAGIGSSTFRDMESVWCSSDRNRALTEAKLGHRVSAAKCSNPVARQLSLGEKMGVRGTPAIFMANGRSLGGYLSVEELLMELEDD